MHEKFRVSARRGNLYEFIGARYSFPDPLWGIRAPLNCTE